MVDIEKNQCIFILSPHVDDGELGCGGTISKLTSKNADIHFIVFSLAEKSIPSEFPKDSTKKELNESMKTLKIPQNNIHLFNYEVRTFPQVRQEILEILTKLNKELSPDIVFTPSLNDLHQDHEVVAKETLRAFKKKTIFCYEEPWNIIKFSSSVVIKLTRNDIETKVKALSCYKSQAYRPYFKEEVIYNLANARGTLIDHQYAEAFEIVRLIIE